MRVVKYSSLATQIQVEYFTGIFAWKLSTILIVFIKVLFVELFSI